MTNIALIAKGLSPAADALITLRHDQFHPPCWQIWDGPGERLIAAFASRGLLDAAMPASHIAPDALRAAAEAWRSILVGMKRFGMESEAIETVDSYFAEAAREG